MISSGDLRRVHRLGVTGKATGGPIPGPRDAGPTGRRRPLHQDRATDIGPDLEHGLGLGHAVDPGLGLGLDLDLGLGLDHGGVAALPRHRIGQRHARRCVTGQGRRSPSHPPLNPSYLNLSGFEDFHLKVISPSNMKVLLNAFRSLLIIDWFKS